MWQSTPARPRGGQALLQAYMRSRDAALLDPEASGSMPGVGEQPCELTGRKLISGAETHTERDVAWSSRCRDLWRTPDEECRRRAVRATTRARIVRASTKRGHRGTCCQCEYSVVTCLRNIQIVEITEHHQNKKDL